MYHMRKQGRFAQQPTHARRRRLLSTHELNEDKQSVNRSTHLKQWLQAPKVSVVDITKAFEGENATFNTVSTLNHVGGNVARKNDVVLVHISSGGIHNNHKHKVGNVIQSLGPTWHSTWLKWTYAAPGATYLTHVPREIMNNPQKYGAEFSRTCSLVNHVNDQKKNDESVKCYPTVFFHGRIRGVVTDVRSERSSYYNNLIIPVYKIRMLLDEQDADRRTRNRSRSRSR